MKRENEVKNVKKIGRNEWKKDRGMLEMNKNGGKWR